MKHQLIVRASSIGAIMTGSTRVGLTAIQTEELKKLELKEELTEKQKEKMQELIKKRDQKPTLSETAKKEIQKIALFNKYGIEDEFSSKPTDKGIMNEPESIRIASEILGWFDIPLSKSRLMNDFITGEPDVLKKGIMVADVKSSFSGLTFPWFAEELPNASYYWQMQSYMWLSDLDTSELVYVLTDTPEQMILDMIQKKYWKMLPDPQYSDFTPSEIEQIADDHVRSQHNFDHIPMEKRVKQFIVKRDNDAIEAMKNQIAICREYYDLIIEQI